MENKVIMYGKVPANIQQKAFAEVMRIMKGGSMNGGWKKLRRSRNVIRYRLNDKYRLVVDTTNLHEGPYFCMKHNKFDNLF